MLSENTLETISKLFCGDIEGCYSYKNGESLVAFFNEYLEYEDEYKSGFNTRWRYVNEKIVDLIHKQKINDFFNIILSVDYIKKEQSLSEVEAAEKASENYLEINKLLNTSSYSLLKTNTGFYLSEDGQDMEKIGRGGFATAYLHSKTGLVVKKLNREYLADSSIRSRFKREFEITSSLGDIDGVIAVYDFNENNYSYTMEKANSTLEKVIESHNELTEGDRIRIIRRILTIMSEVHKRGVVHRDLSPNNIFAIKRRLKIADFGLGKDLTIIHSHQTKYTNGFGQYYYCSPEQMRSLKKADKRSDVYSLGKIINFVMTSDPEKSNHSLRSIAEISTQSDPDKRFEDAEQMLTKVDSYITLTQNSEYEKSNKEKIAVGKYDEEVDNYIYNMSPSTISKNIMTKEKGFQNALIKFMRTDSNKAKSVIRDIENTYKEVCGWTFAAYDPFALLAYNILNDSSLSISHEVAASILSQIAYEVRRFSAQRYIEDLEKKGVDPIIQDILHEND